MGKILLSVIFLIVGLALGTLFGGAIVGGGAAGIGIATGLGAGICSKLNAAQEEGLLTVEEVDQVMTRATAETAEISGETLDGPIVDSAAGCDAVLDRQRSAAAS